MDDKNIKNFTMSENGLFCLIIYEDEQNVFYEISSCLHPSCVAIFEELIETICWSKICPNSIYFISKLLNVWRVNANSESQESGNNYLKSKEMENDLIEGLFNIPSENNSISEETKKFKNKKNSIFDFKILRIEKEYENCLLIVRNKIGDIEVHNWTSFEYALFRNDNCENSLDFEEE